LSFKIQLNYQKNKKNCVERKPIGQTSLDLGDGAGYTSNNELSTCGSQMHQNDAFEITKKQRLILHLPLLIETKWGQICTLKIV
jgi:hypothetical protein